MYDKILVPLDSSKLAECVIPHVISLAKGMPDKDEINPSAKNGIDS